MKPRELAGLSLLFLRFHVLCRDKQLYAIYSDIIVDLPTVYLFLRKITEDEYYGLTASKANIKNDLNPITKTKI